MPLVSAPQINVLRKIAYRGLDTPYTIWRPSRVDNGYGTDQIVFTQVGSGICWMRQSNNPFLHVEVGQELATNIYRMLTEFNKDIQVSDEIRIGDNAYIVQNTNEDDTIRVFSTVTVRRVD